VWGHRLGPGDRVAIETAGAGGYGPPDERAPAEQERDRIDAILGR
jgi:N-methylhydantoinase B